MTMANIENEFILIVDISAVSNFNSIYSTCSVLIEQDMTTVGALKKKLQRLLNLKDNIACFNNDSLIPDLESSKILNLLPKISVKYIDVNVPKPSESVIAKQDLDTLSKPQIANEVPLVPLKKPKNNCKKNKSFALGEFLNQLRNQTFENETTSETVQYETGEEGNQSTLNCNGNVADDERKETKTDLYVPVGEGPTKRKRVRRHKKRKQGVDDSTSTAVEHPSEPFKFDTQSKHIRFSEQEDDDDDVFMSTAIPNSSVDNIEMSTSTPTLTKQLSPSRQVPLGVATAINLISTDVESTSLQSPKLITPNILDTLFSLRSVHGDAPIFVRETVTTK